MFHRLKRERKMTAEEYRILYPSPDDVETEETKQKRAELIKEYHTVTEPTYIPFDPLVKQESKIAIDKIAGKWYKIDPEKGYYHYVYNNWYLREDTRTDEPVVFESRQPVEVIFATFVFYDLEVKKSFKFQHSKVQPSEIESEEMGSYNQVMECDSTELPKYMYYKLTTNGSFDTIYLQFEFMDNFIIHITRGENRVIKATTLVHGKNVILQYMSLKIKRIS